MAVGKARCSGAQCWAHSTYCYITYWESQSSQNVVIFYCANSPRLEYVVVFGDYTITQNHISL